METDRRSDLYEEWKRRAFLGPLPHGFLRIEDRNAQQQQEAADQQAALALQQLQMQNMPAMQEPYVGRLSITIAQAKLVKNYGMTRMDPYVRMRVGHAIYETHTDSNGAKNPRWNKVIQCYLPPGVSQIYVEVYDECSFVMDELIAWGHIDIPPQVLQKGETHEDWYMLSGKQGDNQEGHPYFVSREKNVAVGRVFVLYCARRLSFFVPLPPSIIPHQQQVANEGSIGQTKCQPYMGAPPIMMVPSSTMFGMAPYAPVNVYTAPPAVVMPPVIPSSLPNAELELKQIAEMFPNVDKEVIKSVYDANNGKKDVTINSLLQMCE